MNHNHNGVHYATTRYAQDFLDACQEHRFARRLIGLANTKVDNEWTIQRAMKSMIAARRRRKLAKDRLDRYRHMAKAAAPRQRGGEV